MIFGAISGVIFYDFSVLFSIKKVNDFSIDLSSIFGGFRGSKSLKMSTSCRRDARFHKIAFSDSGTILEANMMKQGSKMEPKWLQKLMKKSMQLLARTKIGFWSQNGLKMEPKWGPTSRNFVAFRATLRRRLQGGQMEASELQNGAKMEAKGSQMEVQAS